MPTGSVNQCCSASSETGAAGNARWHSGLRSRSRWGRPPDPKTSTMSGRRRSVRLEERVPQPHRPAGAGEVAFDEHAHRPARTRHPQLGAQAARGGRVDRARLLSRSWYANGDRGGDELIVGPEGVQRVNGDHSGLAAQFEGRLGPWNADRPREVSGRDSRGGQVRRGFGSRTAWRPLWCRRLGPDSGGYRGGRSFRLALVRAPAGTVDPLLQRRQCPPLLLDDSRLAIERGALIGDQLPQFRNRRVSTRRPLRERGTGHTNSVTTARMPSRMQSGRIEVVSYVGSRSAPRRTFSTRKCVVFTSSEGTRFHCNICRSPSGCRRSDGRRPIQLRTGHCAFLAPR